MNHISTKEELNIDGAMIQKSTRLVDRVYELVKDLIVRNKIAPGQVLMENKLAKSLGISRSPVREALNRLNHEGLVVIEPWKGAVVAPLTAKYVREVYEVRCALESLAAKKAAPIITDEEIDREERQLEILRISLEMGDSGPFTESDIPFHNVFISKCCNELLCQQIYMLRDHFARIRAFAGTILEHTHESYQEHWDILTAMRSKDPHLLERAVRRHLENVCIRLEKAMEKNKNKEKSID